MHIARTIYVSFSRLREGEVKKIRFGHLSTLLKAASSKLWKWCFLLWNCIQTQDMGPRREIGGFPSKFTSNQFHEHCIICGCKSAVQLMMLNANSSNRVWHPPPSAASGVSLKTTPCFVRSCCLLSQKRRTSAARLSEFFFFFLPVMTDCVVADVLEGVQILAVQEQFITSLTQCALCKVKQTPPPSPPPSDSSLLRIQPGSPR